VIEPGTEIVRQGAAGDRFFVIAEGEVEVSADGRELSVHGAGGYFGEIALLRDVPRTATVTARTRVVLYALERDDFLAAVTEYAPSFRAAEGVITARLAVSAADSASPRPAGAVESGQ
jgi:CRP-like cAMP-binding protein